MTTFTNFPDNFRPGQLYQAELTGVPQGTTVIVRTNVTQGPRTGWLDISDELTAGADGIVRPRCRIPMEHQPGGSGYTFQTRINGSSSGSNDKVGHAVAGVVCQVYGDEGVDLTSVDEGETYTVRFAGQYLQTQKKQQPIPATAVESYGPFELREYTWTVSAEDAADLVVRWDALNGQAIQYGQDNATNRQTRGVDVQSSGPTITIESPDDNTSQVGDSVDVVMRVSELPSGSTVRVLRSDADGAGRVIAATREAADVYVATVPLDRSADYTLTARVFNGVYDIATDSIAITRINTGPTASIVAPADGLSTTDEAILVEVDAADSDGTVSQVTVFRTSPGAILTRPATLNNATGRWEATVPLEVSANEYFARVRDDDNEATDTPSRTATRTPNAAPTVAIASPADGATLAHDSGSVDVDLTADDSDGTVAAVSLQVDGPGGQSTHAATEQSAGSYRVTLALFEAGTYTLTPTATDDDGSETTGQSRSVTRQAAPDTTAPTVAITSPDDGAVVEAGHSLDVVATFSDDRAVAFVAFDVNGAEVSRADNPSSGTATLSRSYAAGSHLVTARVQDSAGNESTASVTLTAGAPPAAPTVDTLETIDTTPELAGGYSEATAVDVTVDGQTHVAALDAGRWTVTLPTLAPGTYDVTVVARNQYGQRSDTTTDELTVVAAQDYEPQLPTAGLNEFRGDAPAVSQVVRIDFDTIAPGYFLTVAVYGESDRFLIPSSNEQEAAADFAEWFNQTTSRPPAFALATATTQAGVVLLTATTAGQPFAVSIAAAAAIDVSLIETVRSSGPEHFDDPRNWTLQRVPTTGDALLFRRSVSHCRYGLLQEAAATVVAGKVYAAGDFRVGQILRATGTAAYSSTEPLHVAAFDNQTGEIAFEDSTGTAVPPPTNGETFRVAVVAKSITGYASCGTEIGLPRSTGNSPQPRPHSLRCRVNAGADNLRWGLGAGTGCRLARFDFGGSVVSARIVRTAGSKERGRPALEVAAIAGRLLTLAGTVGVGHPDASPTGGRLDEIICRGGSILLEEGVAPASVDDTAGGVRYRGNAVGRLVTSD